MIVDTIFSEHVRKADLIIEQGGDTFVCYRSRVPFSHQGNTETLPIWKILCYHTETVDNTKRTQLLYPNGRDAYEFAPSEIENYNFFYLV